MDPKSYQKLADRRTGKSPLWKDCLFAFLIGGAICTVGELLRTFFGELLHLDRETAGMCVSASLIFLSALLTGMGLYEKIAKYGGAGTLVPITGFANAMVSPAVEFKREGFVLGVGPKVFSVAGPVILYGTLAAAVRGAVYAVTQAVSG